MKTSRVLAILVLLVALVMAYGHGPLAYGVSSLFREGRPPPPRPSNTTAARPPTSGGSAFFFALGGYFLFAMIIYILGGIFVVAGKLFRLANIALIIMAVVDDVLLLYTRTMPNIFFGRMIGWSWGWFPSLGTVQVFVGQTILILLCLVLLFGRKASSPSTMRLEKPA